MDFLSSPWTMILISQFIHRALWLSFRWALWFAMKDIKRNVLQPPSDVKALVVFNSNLRSVHMLPARHWDLISKSSCQHQRLVVLRFCVAQNRVIKTNHIPNTLCNGNGLRFKLMVMGHEVHPCTCSKIYLRVCMSQVN